MLGKRYNICVDWLSLLCAALLVFVPARHEIVGFSLQFELAPADSWLRFTPYILAWVDMERFFSPPPRGVAIGNIAFVDSALRTEDPELLYSFVIPHELKHLKQFEFLGWATLLGCKFRFLNLEGRVPLERLRQLFVELPHDQARRALWRIRLDAMWCPSPIWPHAWSFIFVKFTRKAADSALPRLCILLGTHPWQFSPWRWSGCSTPSCRQY